MPKNGVWPCCQRAIFASTHEADRAGKVLTAGNKENSMTSEEHIVKMTTAIRQAIKVMGDRFGSTEQDVTKAIHELKMSMQGSTEPKAILGDSMLTT
jgi:hypothetical protein